jgi:hypothetical protein
MRASWLVPQAAQAAGSKCLQFFFLFRQALDLFDFHEQARIRLQQAAFCGGVSGAFRVKGGVGNGVQLRFLLRDLVGVFGAKRFCR